MSTQKVTYVPVINGRFYDPSNQQGGTRRCFFSENPRWRRTFDKVSYSPRKWFFTEKGVRHPCGKRKLWVYIFSRGYQIWPGMSEIHKRYIWFTLPLFRKHIKRGRRNRKVWILNIPQQSLELDKTIYYHPELLSMVSFWRSQTLDINLVSHKTVIQTVLKCAGEKWVKFWDVNTIFVIRSVCLSC